MERPSSGSALQTLLEAIKSSDVVENRIELLAKLCGLDLTEKSDVTTLVECLITFWEDFTCLDTSQCLLNKAILQVAAKYVNTDLSGSLLQFLLLGTKASSWCGKHMRMTLMSTEESQEEEHCNLFFQLLLDFLSLCVASLMALTRYPVLTDNASMVIVETFILEQLNLTKDLVSEIKRTNSFGSDLLKVAQTVIDSVTRVCKEYSVAVNLDLYDAGPKKVENGINFEKANMVNHVINITKCAVEKLCELGVLAANDGGNLVTILNVSWKGVVTLLQLGKRVLTDIVSVQDIIITLISLVNKPLKCAAEAWSSPLKETITVTEARRIFLPIKFYLINAVKISSLYPCQVYRMYREVTLCILMISTFRILLSYDIYLNTASEAFSELLEKTSLDLLNCLLNSAEVKQELKFELLDWLFNDECCSNSIHRDSSSDFCVTSMVEIFSVSCEDMPKARLLLLGRFALFQNLLLNSAVFEEDVKIKISSKLRWFLDLIVDEEVYSSILGLQIPILYGSGKTMALVWQPMFHALLHALKTFMIVVSSSVAWVELEAFLLENLFHPHFLCWEVVMELWCFLMRYGELDMVSGIIHKLCSLMKLLVSPESVFRPGSPLREVARIICLLLTNCASSLADHVYSSIVGDDGSPLSPVLYVALLLEGFPLNSLSDDVRSVAKQKIISDYFGFLGGFDNKRSTACGSSAIGIPVLALSASLHSCQVSMSDVDMKTLKFLVAVIRNFRNPVDKLMKEHCHKLLSEMLGIISNMKHLYESVVMEEVILELRNLFISDLAASDARLHQCKPYLALFMGGLGEIEMSETDNCAKSCAVWELYRMLFREQHWALAYLALASFGYFAAHTSCNQLWRFVPQNAALSYDLMSANEANEERFMSALKAFLEKETALLAITPSFEQLDLLVKEGMVLKAMVQKFSDMNIEAMECRNVEIDVDNQSNKRRKLPDEISQGVKLLQSSLKMIGDGLSQWQQNNIESSELHDNFLTQFSRLEDVIVCLMGLTDSG